jgi:hypothetical protein
MFAIRQLCKAPRSCICVKYGVHCYVRRVVLLQGWHISLLGDAALGFDAVEVDRQLLGMLRIQKISYVGSRRLIIFLPPGIFAIDKAVK